MPQIRARDLRVIIKDMGFEKGMVHVLELALEQQAEMRLSIRSMADLLDSCINEIEKLVVIGDQVRGVVNQLRRDITKEHDDGEHS